jgi:hypothetical protein
MEKAKYRVYIGYTLSYTYVTTTRNCEDMICEIRKMHESLHYDYFRITREGPDGKEVVVYFKPHKRKTKWTKDWESELYKT